MKTNLDNKYILLLLSLLAGGSLSAMDALKRAGENALSRVVDGVVSAAKSQTAEDLMDMANRSMKKAGRGIEQAVEWGVKKYDDRVKAIEQKAKQEIDELTVERDNCYRVANDPNTSEIVQRAKIDRAQQINMQIDAINKKVNDETEPLRRLANKALAAPEAVADWWKARDEKQQELENQRKIAGDAAYNDRKKSNENTRTITQAAVNALKDRKVQIGILSIVGGAFALWQGTKLAAKILRDKYEIPELADRDMTSLIAGPERLYNFVTGSKSTPVRLADAIFEPKLAKQINDITTSFRTVVKNGGFLPNILLWGPPGTGKTLVSQLIARSSDMEFMVIKGSAIAGYRRAADAEQALRSAFTTAKDYPKKVVMIIDEAEAVCGHRANATPEMRQALTTILAYTGTPSREISVIFLTNRPGDLDEAVLSRCAYRLQIDLPGYNEVLAMVKFYINKSLIECSDLQPAKPSLAARAWAWVSGKKEEEHKKIKIAEGALSDDVVEDMAHTLANHKVSGRLIQQLVGKIQAQALINDFIVTPEIVREAVMYTLEEKRAEDAGFKRNAEALPLA